jgi:hypothetical protein
MDALRLRSPAIIPTTILLMTGYADQRERAAHSTLIHDMLTKPFTLATMLASSAGR